MKNCTRWLTALTLCAASMMTWAAERSPIYLGGTLGSVDIDASGHGDASNVGVLFGYVLTDMSRATIAVEGEVTTSVDRGGRVGGSSWKADTLGVFAVYRTEGEGYFKIRAGIAEQKISGTDAVEDDTTPAFGFGAGYRLSGKTSMELNYTAFNDISYLSVGVHTHF